MTQVHKFGGASIRDAEAIRNLGRIVQTLPEHCVIVLSAMGKTTNALEQVVEHYYDQTGEAVQHLESLRSWHQQIVTELEISSPILQAALNDILVEAEWILEDELHDSYEYLYDQIVAVGELLGSTIVAAYLQQQGLPVVWTDARSIICTDDHYRHARINWDKTRASIHEVIRPLLAQGRLILTQGFIGGTSENNSSTLGREGSDYTGAILAACLGANSLTLWKDVDGVYDADPKYFADAKPLASLSFDQVRRMTELGAKIIHHKTIGPVEKHGVQLFVKSFLKPELEGTHIARQPSVTNNARIRILKREAVLLLLSLGDTLPHLQLPDLVDILLKEGIRVYAQHQTENAYALVLEKTDVDHLEWQSILPGQQVSFKKVKLLSILNPHPNDYDLVAQEALMQIREDQVLQVIEQ